MHLRTALLAGVAAAVVGVGMAAEARLYDQLKHKMVHPKAMRADWGDSIQVFKVEAPLSKAKFGNLLGNMNLYHTGLVFYNRVQNTNHTWEFTATDFGHFFPTANNGKLHWRDGALVVPTHDYDGDYWSRFEYVADMDGSAYNRYIDWTQMFNHTHPEYLLFQVDSPNGQVRSATCYDFVFDSLNFLQTLPSVNLVNHLMWRDTVSVKASTIAKVNMQLPASRKAVYSFYETLSTLPQTFSGNMTTELVNNVRTTLMELGGMAYVKSNTTKPYDEFYGFTPKAPYLQVTYEQVMFT